MLYVKSLKLALYVQRLMVDTSFPDAEGEEKPPAMQHVQTSTRICWFILENNKNEKQYCKGRGRLSNESSKSSSSHARFKFTATFFL